MNVHTRNYMNTHGVSFEEAYEKHKLLIDVNVMANIASYLIMTKVAVDVGYKLVSTGKGNTANNVATAEDLLAGKGTSGQSANVIKGFNQTETKIIFEAKNILNSEAMSQIQQAHASGQSVTVVIDGRVIQYEPNLPTLGMTMFGENGFLIGKEAFKSQSELQKTILHELHCLNTSSSANCVSGSLAAQETKAAFDFAEKASSVLESK